MYSETERMNLRAIFDLVFRGDSRRLQARDFQPYLNQHISIRSYPRGATIVAAAAPTTTIYLIVRGRCHFVREMSSGASIVVDDRSLPTFQGVALAINGVEAYTTRAVADRECLVVLFEADYLLRGLEEDGCCAMDVIRDLSRSVGNLRSRMDAASVSSSEERLFLYIYRQYYMRGAPDGDFYIVDNKNKIAAAVGVSVRTLYRTIERLEAAGQLQLAYRGLMIPEAEMQKIIEHFSSEGVPIIPGRYGSAGD